jgi:glycosyltransferase involved in cell wall biosynthesis
MKIVFLLQDTGAVYGAERATIDLAVGLKNTGEINSHIILIEETRCRLGTAFRDALAGRGIEFSAIPCGSAFSLPLALGVRRRLRELKAQVLHTVGYKADVHGFLATMGLNAPKHVATVHGWLFRPDRKERFYRWGDVRVLQHFDAVIALSSHYRYMLLQEGVPAKRLHLIPSGLGQNEINHPLLSVAGEHGAHGEEKGCSVSSVNSSEAGGKRKIQTRVLATQHESNVFTFGMLGRLSSEKNHTMFIRALDILKERGMDFRALIAGDGPLRKDVESVILQKGLQVVVTMPGYMNAMDFFRQIDVLVVCSRIESLPYSVLEAMRSGKPVIATRVGGLPDLVEDDRTGFLVELDAIEQLADRMLTLMRNPEKGREMGAAASKRQAGEFSLDRMVEKHVELYKRLVGGCET